MADMQKFLYEYTREVHTIKEIINALMEKGLTEEEADNEFKIFDSKFKKAGFDMHPQININRP